MNIRYIKGDATSPQGSGKKIIAHICNDIGKWGRGFVLAISKKWKEPENEYLWWWFNISGDFEMGEVQFVDVGNDIVVANMIGQKGIKKEGCNPPIRYGAVDTCLKRVSEKALEINAEVHMPRIGCGLAGGKWEEIEPLIKKNLLNKGINVHVYDL